MQRDRDDVCAALERKGFHQTDADHHKIFLYYTKEGKKTSIRTRVSRGSKYRRIDDALIAQMAKQLNLSKSQFIEFIECTLTQKKFENYLRKQGSIR